jgi:SAM-dependent methyltransferase
MKFFDNLLARQFRRPTGLLGIVAVRFMEKSNMDEIKWALELCAIRAYDIVLEIGFGHGRGIAMAAAHAAQGKVFGLDFSKDMVKKAAKLTRALVSAKRVELKLGDLNPAPFPGDFFDKIFAVNVVYFWPDPRKELNEIARMLKPGGRAVLYLSDRRSMDAIPATNTGVFHKYTADEFLPIISSCAFRNVRYESRVQTVKGREFLGHCFIAEK